VLKIAHSSGRGRTRLRAAAAVGRAGAQRAGVRAGGVRGRGVRGGEGGGLVVRVDKRIYDMILDTPYKNVK